MLPPSPAQTRVIWFAATFFAVGLIIALLAGSVWALGRVLNLFSPVLWPLAVAMVVAYLLDPVVDFLERRKVPRNRAIVCVFAMAVVIFLGIGGALVPRLVVETRELVSRIPTYATQIQDRASGWIERAQARFDSMNPRRDSAVVSTNTTAVTNAPAVSSGNTDDSWESKATQAAVSWLKTAGPAIGSWILDRISRVAAWFGILSGIALVPVYCYYFLTEKSGIQRNWKNYLPIYESKLKDELVFILTSINDYLIVFFRGQVLVAMCDAVLYTIGFFSVGLHYALLMGLIAGALSIVPFLGAVLTIIPAVALAAVQHRDFLHPALVVAVFGAVQAIEGLVISPRIIGDRVGLHPLTVMIAVIVGTTLLGGILGGILAIPLTAALRVLMFRYIWKAATQTIPDSAATKTA